MTLIDKLLKPLRCNRCEYEFTDEKTIVVDRPILLPLKRFTKYYHAQCFNYNRYGILPKHLSTLSQSGKPEDEK